MIPVMSNLQSLAALRRVGVVVPPANPAAEPELAALLPDSVSMHVSRLPVLPGDLKARVAQYGENYAAAIAGFGTLKLEAVFIAMTGASYPLGVAGDRALAAQLSHAAGAPVWTASLAIFDALAALGAKRIALVSPYSPWLTELAVSYWMSAGLTLTQVVQVSEDFRAYELAADEIKAAIAKVKTAAVDAVVLSGTGMLSLPAILECRGAVGIPLLSSNLCGAWRLLSALGLPASDALTKAAPQLAKLLSRT